MLFALSLAMPPILQSEEISGGYGGAYLRMAQDARTAALGNSSGAMTADINAVMENPALAATLRHSQLASSAQFLPLDRSLNSLLYGRPIPPTAGITLIWQHAGTGDIQGRDFANNPTETYSSSQDAFTLAFANSFNDLISAGLAVRIMLDRLPQTSASGLALDAGLSFRPFDFLSLGAAAHNLKGDITWDTEDLYEFGGRRVDSLPARFILSAHLRPAPRMSLNLSFKGSRTLYPTLHAGLEYQLSPLFQIRAGLDDDMPAFGFGTDYLAYGHIRSRLDYAFTYGRAREGSGHIFTLLFYFDKN